MKESLKRIDLKILEFIDCKFKKSFFDKTMPLITKSANFGIIWIFLSFFLLYRDDYRTEGILVLSALILTTILGEGIIKHIIKRQRPFTQMDEEESQLLINKPISYSFPSGHTASSFSVVGIFIAMNIKNSGYVTLLASLIAFSRLYLRVHYPTDVFSGIVLGVLSSIIVIYCFNLFGYAF